MVKERWGFYFFICGFYLLQQTFLWWRKFIGILRASCGSYWIRKIFRIKFACIVLFSLATIQHFWEAGEYQPVINGMIVIKGSND